MIEAADRKRELIIEKAVLRFAHFGVQKTTMNEIADDLALSKPSLYYYFPDKISLVVAVAERILNEYLQHVEQIINKASSAKEALFAIIDLRREFFQKYFMLHIGEAQNELHLNNEEFKALLAHVRQKETSLLKALFETQIDRARIGFDFGLTAELYLDSLVGLGICILGRQGKQLMPDLKGFEAVSVKQKALTEIFLKGLKD